MKLFLIFSLLLVCFSGCMYSETEKAAVIPEHFKHFMDTYFHSYKYEYQDTNARGNNNYGEQYGLINIRIC